MKVETIVNGMLNENCYIVYNNSFALIIDPGSEIDKITNFINKHNLTVESILITHYHFDHVLCLEELNEIYNTNIIDYTSDSKISTEHFNFEIIKTYGHTLDSVSYLFKDNNIIFTGDFLFKETIGNYTSNNKEEMYKSLLKVKEFNKDLIVYPGHGKSTTIEYELDNNPFLVDLC